MAIKRPYRSIFLAVAISIAASPAFAGQLDALADLVRCEEAPEPTEALTKLVADGVLLEANREGMDSEYCWALSSPVTVNGLDVSRVCASQDDPDIALANPDIYWRGPGTSPGTKVSFVSVSGEETVTAWVGEEAPKATVRPSPFYSGETEVVCAAPAN